MLQNNRFNVKVSQLAAYVTNIQWTLKRNYIY